MINNSASGPPLSLGGAAVFAALGLGAGVAVTRHAHRVPASPWWDQRVGQSKLRHSDLPAGGAVALLTAAVLHATGQRRAALAVAALGIGAAAGALGTGFAEPHPSRRAARPRPPSPTPAAELPAPARRASPPSRHTCLAREPDLIVVGGNTPYRGLQNPR